MAICPIWGTISPRYMTKGNKIIRLGGGNALKRLTASSFLTAAYVALSFFCVRMGNYTITLAPLPIILSAVLFGPIEGVCVAALGEFLVQVALYGFTPTTAIWMAAPLFRPLLIGLVSLGYSRKGEALEDHWVALLISIVSASLLVTGLNTLALYLDSLIYGYPFAFAVVETLIRVAFGLATAAICFLLSRPLIRSIRSLMNKK